MSVNISIVDTPCFEQISITELGNECFDISVVGNKNDLYNGVFVDEIKSLSAVDKVITIIQKFLDNYKINGVTKSVVLYHNSDKYSLVYLGDESKQMRLKLMNSRFRFIHNIIMNKYFNDRYDFFWNNDIKLLQLQSDSSVSKYETFTFDFSKCEMGDIDSSDLNCIRYTMMTDYNGNIALSERNFISEYLYYKFWQYAKEVKIFDVGDTKCIGKSRERIIKCGDMVIKFPNSFEFSFLGNIVKEYNRELFEIKQNDKKMQLKMEGF